MSLNQAAIQSLEVAGDDTVYWHRSGTGPKVAFPPDVLVSLNGSSFTASDVMDIVDQIFSNRFTTVQ